ncbi:low temperature requirement protein A [Plantactinospora sp. ZYX-F-223]|uniref:low temperature requirement protein A n=1 Tax=Plantactinospora sp. ZYX-F-223 TaxID=3144103 RepID=UPI0031FD9D31
MRRLFRFRTAPTSAGTDRASPFELFFDLVFVFALTQIIAFMGHPPSFTSMARGAVLLLLLWFSWGAYIWLSNQARADVGLIRAGTLLAMAALFVAALVIPDAWRTEAGSMRAPLILVMAYVTLRAVHLGLYYRVAAHDPAVRTGLRVLAIPIVLAWIPLVLGALYGGTAQTLLWAVSLLVDIGGQRLSLAAFGGWQLRNPVHFSERHNLALIIALGESLISVGTGAGTAVTHPPVLAAALLALLATVCLWRLYFENVGPAAARALAGAPPPERDRIAADGYGLAYLLMITGIIYSALGIEQVVATLAEDRSGGFAGEPLDWPSVIALYGGAAIYLAGRPPFLWVAVRSAPRAQLGAVGVALLLLPAGRHLPALAAFGLIVALLVVVTGYERAFWRPAPES